MAVSSVKDIVEDVKSTLGVTRVEAETYTKLVLETISQHIKHNGGFCYKGQFTIKKTEKKARKGKIVRKDPNTGNKTELSYETPSSVGLKITIGSDLKDELNNHINATN